MTTTLSRRLTTASVEETVNLVRNGQIPLEDFGTALLAMSEQDARKRLQSLPVPIQSSTMHLTIGGGNEAPLLTLMKSKEAVTAMMIDVSMFEVTSLMVDMMRGDEGTAVDEVREERSRRTVVIVDPKGNSRIVPVTMNPERAWVYFQTVARNPDQAWRERVMRRLGLNYLGYLHACIDEGLLDVEDDDWFACLDACDEDYRHDALQQGRTHSAEALEDELITRHANSMKKAFKLPEDFMKNPEVAAAKADDLVGDLDLG